MTTEPLDRLSTLLERFRVRARLFHTGALCGVTHFDAQPGRGFLHVLRRGQMVVTHRDAQGQLLRVLVNQPTLVFYPQPLPHDFHNTLADDCDFVCATVEFEGGALHPLARALPPLLVLPLAQLDGLSETLNLLFAETEQVRCGQRLLADRLFEVLLLQLLRWMLNHPQQAGMSPGLLNGLSHPQLARTLVAMHEKPGHPWSLQSMAHAAGMSRSAFAPLFKDCVGLPPAQYLAQLRIALAQQMVQRGVAIKTIADELGYASASSLARVFSQVVGSSPRDWLKGQARAAAL